MGHGYEMVRKRKGKKEGNSLGTGMVRITNIDSYMWERKGKEVYNDTGEGRKGDSIVHQGTEEDRSGEGRSGDCEGVARVI